MGTFAIITDFVLVTFEVHLAIVVLIKVAKLHICTTSIKDGISVACDCC